MLVDGFLFPTALNHVNPVTIHPVTELPKWNNAKLSSCDEVLLACNIL